MGIGTLVLGNIIGFLVFFLFMLFILFLALRLTFKRKLKVKFGDAFKVWLYVLGLNIFFIIILIVLRLKIDFVLFGVPS